MISDVLWFFFFFFKKKTDNDQEGPTDRKFTKLYGSF